MTTLMIVMRLVHIGLGVMWAGTIWFFVLFLEPSLREAGPDGAKVMQGIMRRGYLTFMPVIAILTIVSGIGLYERVSVGFSPVWMSSSVGMTLTIGAVAALLAFVIGMVVMRASALKVGALAPKMQQAADDAERARLQGQIQALQVRARTGARWVAVLLVVAVAAMAAGRYM